MSRFPTDEGLNALVDELLALSPEFRAMWTEHPVSNCPPSRATSGIRMWGS
ncbi:hypothetical protein [Nonomuraea sp. NPDC005692]|uniref:MmyB family transcriptional regulator n=1 Tax=Nonomuraea sp. NPDC005692 TaxID=3157168 RepID=UPI0033E4F62D